MHKFKIINDNLASKLRCAISVKYAQNLGDSVLNNTWDKATITVKVANISTDLYGTCFVPGVTLSIFSTSYSFCIHMCVWFINIWVFILGLILIATL